jgi:hypothetical protein
MTSMLDGVSDLVTPALVSSASARTGESDDAVLKGLALATSALFTSLADRCGDDHFMRRFASLAADTGADSGPERPVNSGGCPAMTVDEWIASQQGDGVSSVADGIARRAGIERSSAVSLLSIAAPLVLGHLGRALRSGAIEVSGLTARLRFERGRFASAAQNEDSMMAGIGPGGSHELIA